MLIKARYLFIYLHWSESNLIGNGIIQIDTKLAGSNLSLFDEVLNVFHVYVQWWNIYITLYFPWLQGMTQWSAISWPQLFYSFILYKCFKLNKLMLSLDCHVNQCAKKFISANRFLMEKIYISSWIFFCMFFNFDWLDKNPLLTNELTVQVSVLQQCV